MKLQGVVVMLLSLIMAVCSYNPCSDIFKRIYSSKRGDLFARLELNSENVTKIQLHITFTDVVKLHAAIKVESLSSPNRNSSLPTDSAHQHSLETQDNKTFIINYNSSNINQSHNNLAISVSLNISYPGEYIDVSSIYLNNQSLCSGAEICGVTPNSQFLIHKGSTYQRGEWPWQAALHKKSDATVDFFCAGTLVSRRHVVTAAHCIRKKDSYCKTFENEKKNLVVLLGLHKLLDFQDPWTQTLEVSHFLEHHEWGTDHNGATDADVAVLILDKQVEFNKYVAPACLNFDHDDIGVSGRIAGWGLNEEGFYNTEPVYTIQPIVSNEVCRQSQPLFNKITTNRTFCAGHRNGTGPCNGDSGGGFFTRVSLPGDRPRYGLTGIVSRALTKDDLKGYCDLQHYAVFTRLSSFKQWIAEAAGGFRKLSFNQTEGVKYLAARLENTTEIAEQVHKEGNYNAALILFNTLLENQQCLFGLENNDTLNTLHWKADTLEKLNRDSEALKEFKTLVETLKSVLGEDSEDTLLAMHNRAFTLEKVGKFNESLEIYTQVIKKRQIVLGYSHPKTILSMHNKAVTLDKLGRLNESIILYNEVIEKSKQVLGNDHNETVRAMFNKASTLDKLGLFKDSIVIYDQLIEKQGRNLGENHVDTLKSMNKKANALSKLGRYGEALQFYDVVIEKRKKVLGDFNIHTLASMSNKASTLVKLGRFNEAQLLYNKVSDAQKLIESINSLNKKQA